MTWLGIAEFAAGLIGIPLATWLGYGRPGWPVPLRLMDISVVLSAGTGLIEAALQSWWYVAGDGTSAVVVILALWPRRKHG